MKSHFPQCRSELGCPGRPGYSGGPGFSLVELLVTLSIVSLLMALLLPALSKARDVADQTRCLSNLRQLGIMAGAYGSDFQGWYGMPLYLQYYSSAPTIGAGNTHMMPSQLVAKGFNSVFVSQPDHYVAMDYVSLSHAASEGSVFRCPTATKKLGTIAKNNANRSNVQTHYFFTGLLQDWQRPSAAIYKDSRRDLAHGPYKSEEIAKPSLTFLAGDAVFTMQASGTYQGQYAAGVTYGWNEVGSGINSTSTVFGVRMLPGQNYLSDPPTVHIGSATTVYFDGHAGMVTKPRPVAKEYWTHGPGFTSDYRGRSNYYTTVGPKRP